MQSEHLLSASGTQIINAAAINEEPKPVEVPGYELESRLGSGGFGEVWRAAAPGGMKKAVKIVYGAVTGERAERELKAVDRVREMRHPFLLTMERVEVIDRKLVIVSELADKSLLDLFNESRDNGLPGVDRDELLAYLGEAAEALDFMNEESSLLHLDVKPENLLLCRGHMKVADFGLTKDLQQTALSSPSGMTPIYSSPEVFEGKPTRQSDQYSLAVVFQHMLTGSTPFSGRSLAQVAVQHMRSSPDLSALPIPDRAVIARALAKRPDRRYENCRELIEKLKRRSSGTTGQAARPAGRRTRSVAVDLEQLVSKYPGSNATRAVHDLPAMEVDSTPQQEPQNTLFIGLGGIGGKIVSRVKSLTFDETADEVPCRYLYLDCDVPELTETVYGEGEHHLAQDETLGIALRRSDEYRAESENYLDWLERRWLFNIPRSHTPEGIRPLGRLAVVEHESAIRESIQRQLSRFEMGGPLEIVIVAGAGGGTGGGGFADLARLTLQTWRELTEGSDLEPPALCGVLVDTAANSLAAANAVACVDELFHDSKSAKDEPSQLFGDLYLVATEAGQLDCVADYLAKTTTVEFSKTVKQHRELTRARRGVGDGFLRTVGFAQPEGQILSDEQVDALITRSVRCWLESETEPNSLFADSLLTDSGLSTSAFVAELRSYAGGEATQAVEPMVRSHLETIWQKLQPEERDNHTRVAESTFSPGGPGSHFLAALEARVNQQAEETAELIGERLLALSRPAAGFLGRWAAVLRDVAAGLKQCHQELGSHQQAVAGAKQQISAAEPADGESLPEAVHRLAMLSLVERSLPFFGVLLSKSVEAVSQSRSAAMKQEASLQELLDTVSSGDDDAIFDPELVTRVEQALGSHLAKSTEARSREERLTELRETTFSVGATAVREATTSQELMENAEPALARLGGHRRCFIGAPSGVGETSDSATVIPIANSQTPFVCTEFCEVSISELVREYAETQPRLLEILPQVRTRRDVEW